MIANGKDSLDDYKKQYGEPIYTCYQSLTNIEKKRYDIPIYCFVFEIDHPTKLMVVSGNKLNNLHANHGERAVIYQLLQAVKQLPKWKTSLKQGGKDD